MTNVLKVWFNSIATTIAHVGALLIFAIIYAFLLFASYVFIWIREATVWQVLVTYALLILIPLGFFVLQASIINHAIDKKFRWRAIVIDALKFLAISLPVLALVFLLYYLLNKLSLRYPAPIVDVPPVKLTTPPTKPPLHWPSLLFSTLRFVLLGIAFPLVTTHLWIAVAGGEVRTLLGDGAKSFFTRIASALGRAFSSDSVLIYGLGLLIFFVLPYVILVPTFTVKGNKTEFAFFGVRLVLSFLFSLIGWVSTLTALTKTAPDEPAEVLAPVVANPTEAVA
jgi:hypothetical protein